MRSRFRTMFVVVVSVLLVSVFMLANATSSTQAQSAATAAPTEPVIAVNASNNGGAFITLVRNMKLPAGTVIGDLHANSSEDISFDTHATLDISCVNVVVYRETDLTDLVRHPFTCAGDVLSLTGTGGNYSVDYIIVTFSSLTAAQAAPLFVVRSVQGQSLPQLGGASSATSVATAAAPSTP